MRRAWPLLGISLLLAMPVHAAPTPLEAAERAFDDLEFAEAEKLYRDALEAPGTREERLRALKGHGLSLAFLGKTRAAQDRFESLLLLDPSATVNTALGPKIARPFEAAKKQVRSVRPALELSRDPESGAIVVKLEPPIDLAKTLRAVVTPPGEEPQIVKGPAQRPLRVDVAPHLPVQVFATALDDADGELFLVGSQHAPREFEPTGTAPAVAATPLPDEVLAEVPEVEDEEGGSRWPLWVGGAAVVIGGGVAAAILAQPAEPLRLPSADRTGRLP